MTTFVLTWAGSDDAYNPADDMADTLAGDPPEGTTWGVGQRKKGTAADDRVFLLRQRSDRGIIGSGTLVDGVVDAGYIEVRWDCMLDLADRLPFEALATSVPNHDWDHIYSSGQSMNDAAASEVEVAWAEHLTRIGWSPAT